MRRALGERSMVKQGDIIKVSFDPKSGHEQAGYRPALVISNDDFNKRTKLVIVCTIYPDQESYLEWILFLPIFSGYPST